VEDERRQPERVIAVKVRQEDDVDVNLDTQAMHVRQQGAPASSSTRPSTTTEPL
jgi:hypothetical protein